MHHTARGLAFASLGLLCWLGGCAGCDQEALQVLTPEAELPRTREPAEPMERPSCDDANPCTDDQFDEDQQSCVHTPVAASCTPANRCQTGGICVEGVCLGEGWRECPATSPCREGVCLADLGCVEQDVPDACRDDDPCTEDLCLDDGCHNPQAEDGASCGDTVPCVSFSVCEAGACVELPFPDGAPCSDGDPCTDDICSGGVCVGTPTSSEAALVSQNLRVAGTRSAATYLGDDRWAVVDTFTSLSQGGRISVLERTSSGLVLVGSRKLWWAPERIKADPTTSGVVLSKSGRAEVGIVNDDGLYLTEHTWSHYGVERDSFARLGSAG